MAGREGGVFIAVAIVVEIAAVLAVALSRDRSCREAAWSNRDLWPHKANGVCHSVDRRAKISSSNRLRRMAPLRCDARGGRSRA
jgi:hypothetical protein